MEDNLAQKLKKLEVEMALDFKRICDKHNLKYFMDSGTLLGAVRHKGFIPWDDDMDFGMLREDYEKFLVYAKKELSSENELVEWKSEKDYPHQFCKIMRKGTVFKEEATGGDQKCGVFIDIFPYDNFPLDKKIQKKQKLYIKILRSMIRAKSKHHTWTTDGKFYLNRFLKNLPFIFLSLFFSKKKMIDKYEEIATMYNEKTCEGYFPQSIDNYGDWVIPKECFEKFIDLEFEGELFKAPKDYDLYLSTCYGDYMTLPPIEDRVLRHPVVKIDLGDYE